MYINDQFPYFSPLDYQVEFSGVFVFLLYNVVFYLLFFIVCSCTVVLCRCVTVKEILRQLTTSTPTHNVYIYLTQGRSLLFISCCTSWFRFVHYIVHKSGCWFSGLLGTFIAGYQVIHTLNSKCQRHKFFFRKTSKKQTIVASTNE